MLDFIFKFCLNREKGGKMTNKNQSGRSMTEMLGVLAIMGIVIYGVLIGINSGMTSYKVNQAYIDIDETIKGIQDMYSSVYGRNRVPVNFPACNAGTGPGCNVLRKNGIKYRKMNIASDGNNGFQITYTADSPKICGRLIKLDWAVLSINCKGRNDINCRDADPEQDCIRGTQLIFSPM